MTGVDVAFSATSLLGPWGGMIGLAFGAGAAAGWAFSQLSQRAYIALTNKRFDDLKETTDRDRADCDRRIALLELAVRELHERERNGMERQLAQHRESGLRVLYRDREIRQETPED